MNKVWIGLGVVTLALGGYALYANRDKEPMIIHLLKTKNYQDMPSVGGYTSIVMVDKTTQGQPTMFDWAENQQKAGSKVFYASVSDGRVILVSSKEMPKGVPGVVMWRELEPLSFVDRLMHPGFEPAPEQKTIGQVLTAPSLPQAQKA